MPPENQPSKRVSLSRVRTLGPRLLKLAFGHLNLLALGFLGLAVGSAINLYFPYFIRQVLNGEQGVTLDKDISWITAVLLLLFLVQSAFFYLRHYCFQMVGYRVVTQLRNLLFAAMLRQDVEFFDRSRLGDLLSRLSGDAQLVQRGVTVNISVVLRYLIQVIGGLCLMVIISLRLTLLICLVLPLFVGASALWGKRLRALSKKLQEQFGETNVIAEETIGSLRTVRTFAGEEYERLRFEASNELGLDIARKRTKVAALFSSTMVYVLNASIALVVAYGASLEVQGAMNLGDLTAFLLYCAMVAVSFGFIVGAWEEFLQAVGAAERIFEIVDQEPKIVTPTNGADLPLAATYSLRFDNVSFSYPTRKDVEVLHGVSFEIPAGQTVAIVGPSGAGKSTIASLIPRFYDPTSGTIYLQGLPLTSIALSSLRAAVSMVQQSPQVFSISIKENVRYGRIDASDSEVESVIRAANLTGFIDKLPERENTLVGDKGIQLSGGERQRLAIARALLKNPRLLILDEATSALDSENERLVQQALEHLTKDRTTLVIAHRLSTVQKADVVLVLNNGTVVQSGTHQELMKAEGLYRTLVEHQMLG